MSRITYKDVPLDFRLKHYNNVVDILDSQTGIFCFCGSLATGFHTKCCRKFQNKINQIILKRYKDSLRTNEDLKLLEDNKNEN